MALMTGITKLNVYELAAKLDEPFTMINADYVGDIIVSVYLCHGMLEWHRHVDIDELFWVYEGTMTLESELGEVRLRPGELTVVPKGVGHRSRSTARASVLLLRCGFFPDRKNGRRRLYTLRDAAQLKRISLREVVEKLPEPFEFKTVAGIEDTILQVARGGGNWPIRRPRSREQLIYVLEGTATARTVHSMLHMHPGDFTVIPPGATCQLSTTSGTALVRVTRENAP